MALATARDAPKVRANVLDCARTGGRISRLSICVLAARAVRLDEGVVSNDLRRHPPSSPSRAVGAGRFDVGRSGLQPSFWGSAGSAVRARQAILYAGVRRRYSRALAARRLRLPGVPATADRRVRGRILPDSEAFVERHEQAGTP